MENQNNTGSQQTQAVIENIFLFKDGTIAIGCNLLSGTIKEGDKLYYSDCTGREGFPVTISGVMVPGKGAIPSISAGDENRKRSIPIRSIRLISVPMRASDRYRGPLTASAFIMAVTISIL